MSDSGYGQQWSSGSSASEGDRWASGESDTANEPEPELPPDEANEVTEPTWGETVEQAWDSAVETAEGAWGTVVEEVTDFYEDATSTGDGSPPVNPEFAVNDRAMRDDFTLELMGWRPPDAKRAWNQLVEYERTRVLGVMSAGFGQDFAQAFLASPMDLQQEIGHIRNTAPSAVEAQGYRYARIEGDEQIFYHPSGRTFRLKVFFDGSSDPEDGVSGGADSPAVLEARKLADAMDERVATLQAQIQRCQGPRARPNMWRRGTTRTSQRVGSKAVPTTPCNG